jgi:hypothetical protein
MTSWNFTNPDNPAIERGGIPTWEHKEATVFELQRLGVPFRPAELAVVDYRVMLYACQKGKMSPAQTARMMLDTIERAYKKDDGSWRFST